MERNLTLLVRLFVVAFVGFCVWLVLDSMSGQLASKLFNRDSPVADHQPAADSPAPSHVLPFIGGIVAMIAVAWGIEAFFFRRFEIAVKQIRDLGGTVRFDTSADLSTSVIVSEQLPLIYRTSKSMTEPFHQYAGFHV